MKRFVNEYRCTDAFIRECTEKCSKWKVRKNVIILMICSVIFLLLFLAMRNLTFLIMALLPFGSLGILRLNISKGVKNEISRLHVLNPQQTPLIRVEIGEDISYCSQKANNRIAFSNVEAILETKNQIVLAIKGSMTLPLDKNGFTEGTADECLAYLRCRTGLK